MKVQEIPPGERASKVRNLPQDVVRVCVYLCCGSCGILCAQRHTDSHSSEREVFACNPGDIYYYYYYIDIVLCACVLFETPSPLDFEVFEIGKTW